MWLLFIVHALAFAKSSFTLKKPIKSCNIVCEIRNSIKGSRPLT